MKHEARVEHVDCSLEEPTRGREKLSHDSGLTGLSYLESIKRQQYKRSDCSHSSRPSIQYTTVGY